MTVGCALTDEHVKTNRGYWVYDLLVGCLTDFDLYYYLEAKGGLTEVARFGDYCL